VKGVIGQQPVKLIAGSATNDTQSTIELSRQTEKAGVDALLVVVPYYNKPSQKGMVAHFGAVAQAVSSPVIIYNIPGRSVVNMTAETMATLANAHDNLIGVKQSNPDMDLVSDIRLKTPSSFRLWCGDDSLTLPMLALGADGVFSVASHVVGTLIRQMVDAFRAQDHKTALALHLQLMPVFKELFFLPNPTVVKTCLSQLGMIEPFLRLPLVAPDADELTRITTLTATIRSLMPMYLNGDLALTTR
jgi:4-hydroxy-tetrahydrodipicolinate synthase